MLTPEEIQQQLPHEPTETRALKAYHALIALREEIGSQPWLERAILTLHALIYNPAGVTPNGKPR